MHKGSDPPKKRRQSQVTFEIDVSATQVPWAQCFSHQSHNFLSPSHAHIGSSFEYNIHEGLFLHAVKKLILYLVFNEISILCKKVFFFENLGPETGSQIRDPGPPSFGRSVG